MRIKTLKNIDPSFEWLRQSDTDVRGITENNVLLFDIEEGDRHVTLRAKDDSRPIRDGAIPKEWIRNLLHSRG